MKVNFEEVSLATSKTSKCPVCGKRATLKKKFWQTINPFNKDENGNQKTREQIWDENRKLSEIWKKEPAVHQKCVKEYRKALA
jgi:hypothetical protein